MQPDPPILTSLPPPAHDPAELLDAAPAALLHVDAAGLLQRVNRAARRLCGSDAVPGLPLKSLWTDDAAGLCSATPQRRRLTLAAQAPPLAVEAHSQPLAGGGWMVALHPVQRQADDEAASQLAMAVDLGGIAVWRHDLATQRMHYNVQAWKVLDMPPRPEGLSIDEVRSMIHPDDLPQVLETAQLALRSDSPTDMEARYRRRDGSWREVMTRRVVQRDAQGRALAFLGVALDITDKRQAEAARRERESALRDSQAKSKFLARMSHELRTPLNAVLGFSQLLLADGPGSDEHGVARHRWLEHIHVAGQHLLSLINDVLDLSSLEGGEMAIEMQPVDLAPLVEQTLPLLGTLADERHVTVQARALQAQVMADPVRLRQVLLNLLSNAVKYNRIGGGVTVEALPRGAEVLLRVADTGRGMNDEQLRHLFEPFNRLGREGDARDPVEGSGIGLAIVKALVERMGGSVHVDSTPGVGSVFELRLAAAETAAPAAGRPPAAPQRRQVLYVEDNPVNALIIGELLARRDDLALHVAVDGTSGVARAIELRPDLVLLDMQLPDFDGFEVLRRLRADPRTAAVPCVALSANAMPEDIDRALRAGMAHYWTKPLDFAAFLAFLDTMFGPPGTEPSVAGTITAGP